MAQADCCGDSLRQAGDPMNPWEELKKLPPLSEAAKDALCELMSRPIIDFFIPIEEIEEQWSGTD